MSSASCSRAIALALLGFFAVAAANAAEPTIAILCYHEVVPGGTLHHESLPPEAAAEPAEYQLQTYTVSVESFRAQLDYLEREGYQFISLDQAVRYLTGQPVAIPEKSVVLTIDDGWASTFSEFFPEMKHRHLPFTAFVYPRVIERHAEHPYNVTWEEVKTIERDGGSIESHTFSHPFLAQDRHPQMMPAAYETFVLNELVDSRKILEQQIGRSVQYLAYPFGSYDAEVIEGAKSAGYVAAVTCNPGVNTRGADLYQLKRYLVLNQTTMDEFAKWFPAKSGAVQSARASAKPPARGVPRR